MPLSRRERVRAATIEEIKAIARRHMAEKGAAALSLRGIAREMGMTSPALYRYFASRDDLVTALIVDAYNAFADALETARDSCEKNDHPGRLSAIAHAYRSWALANSHQYALIFGTPIPAYEAPSPITTPVAARSMMVFLDTLQAAKASGQAEFSLMDVDFSPEAEAQLKPWMDKLHFSGEPQILYLAISNWGLIHGLVSLEIFGHLNPQAASDAFYRATVAMLAKRLKIK